MPNMLALLAALAAPQAEAPQLLEPSAKWSIDYADKQCFLSRTFGTGEEQVIFGFGLLPAASSDRIYLLEPARDIDRARAVAGELDLGSGTDRIIASGISTKLKKGGRATRLGTSAESVERFRNAEQVTISVDDKQYKLRLSSMKAAFDAVDACKNDLMRRWGIDPKLFNDVAVPAEPIGSSDAWVTADDYPMSARMNGEMGVATVRLDIDPRGQVTRCALVQTSGSRTLDKATCKLLRSRARFSPALDAAGQSISTLWVARYQWHLEFD